MFAIRKVIVIPSYHGPALVLLSNDMQRFSLSEMALISGIVSPLLTLPIVTEVTDEFISNLQALKAEPPDVFPDSKGS